MSTPLYALLVGVNAYKATLIPQLKGCQNDVELIASVLRSRFDVADDHLRVLVNEQATHSAIKAAIREHLIDNAHRAKAAGQPIPAFLFHFSGHGSMSINSAGAKLTGVDETIVPHDSRQEGILDIKDWELGKLFEELSEYTENVTVVLDCCHSGSGTRDTEMVTRQCPPDLRPQPQRPAEIAAGTRSAAGETRKPLRHVLLAACSNSQRAHEYTDTVGETKRYHGALSFALAEELAKTPAGNASYREIYERVCRRVWQWYPLQSPQCEGDRDRALFGGTRPARELWISVAGLQAGLIKINAGGVHGLCEGGELAVYPEQTRKISPETAPLARLRIVHRDAVFSLCSVMEGTAELPLGCRVQPTSFSAHLTRTLSLAKTSGPTQAALESRLKQPDLAGLLCVTREPQADLQVISSEAGDSLCDAAGAPLESITHTHSSDTLVASIRKWAKYLNALRIENPAPQSKLRGLVAIEIKPASGAAITESSDARLEAGESGVDIQVQLTNRSPDPLYFSLLGFGYDGSIALIWPVDGERIPVPAGKSVTISDLQLSFPGGDSRTHVREALKVFATRTSTDFDLLTMNGAGVHEGTRSVGVKGDSPLDQLLDQAAKGAGTRLIRPKETRAEEDWTTAELIYQLVRPLSERERQLTGGQDFHLAGSGCVMTAPAGFAAKIRIVAETPGQRTLESVPTTESAFPLAPSQAASQLALLTGRLGLSGAPVESFELEADDLARSQLTPSSPLRIQLGAAQRSLESVSSEQVLAIASDGELLYPVGLSEPGSDSVDVTWLPPAGQSSLEGISTRSVVGSIRLYFYKLMKWESGSLGLHRLGWVPQDRAAAIPIATGERVRKFPTGEVRQRRVNPGEILATHKVLVLVHGGLSDATSMAGEICPLLEQSGQTYDQILAFSYETVATGLQESATQFAQSLTAAGLSPADGGRVDLMACGIGALVARAAMEMLGAQTRVSRALLAGPPNTGTLLAQSQNIARWLGTLALAKCALVPQLLPLNMAFNKVINDAAAVRDLLPSSDFLKALNASNPPVQVPYTILSGAAELTPALTGFARRLADQALTQLFDDEHDFVCSQTSMHTLRGGNFPADRLKVIDVPADHFSYWSDPRTIERVLDWLKATG